MTISTYEYDSDDNEDTHQVQFYKDRIQVCVTDNPSTVENWISSIESFHRFRLHSLIVGLDVEWRPSFKRNVQNPVATLQICVGRRCLIFQLIHAPYIPVALRNFLNNSDYTFVGVGKLVEDYGLGVRKTVDLRNLAAERTGEGEYRNSGLKGLAEGILGKEVAKPRRVKLSRWDHRNLNVDQVQYACLDAFLSFDIGRLLNASSN